MGGRPRPLTHSTDQISILACLKCSHRGRSVSTRVSCRLQRRLQVAAPHSIPLSVSDPLNPKGLGNRLRVCIFPTLSLSPRCSFCRSSEDPPPVPFFTRRPDDRQTLDGCPALKPPTAVELDADSDSAWPKDSPLSLKLPLKQGKNYLYFQKTFGRVLGGTGVSL